MSDPLRELIAIMARLRGPDGCPWDREQNFASIANYTIEEAYEVAAAIERGDLVNLRDELGDLLLQVVFHSQMAEEQGSFDFDAVARGICDKLIRRHPHVFGESSAPGAPRSAGAQLLQWEEIKAQERRAAARDAPSSHLDGVPEALPALMRAFKLSKRAAGIGFDFDLAEQAADKVAEELAETRAAAAGRADGAAAAASAAVFEEVGDLLFAAANLARKLEVDAEAALRAANAKFERRFRGMEALASRTGRALEELDLAAQEKLWQAMKRTE